MEVQWSAAKSHIGRRINAVKKQKPRNRTKPAHPRRAVAVTRVRAAAIALNRLARELIRCEVSEELPAGYSVFWHRTPPKNYWYVVCGPRNTLKTGGTRTLICISKRSGRVLLVADANSE